jgi:hypothetical protein
VTEERCGTCRFFSTDSVCRRYPPTPMVVQQQSSIAPNAKPGGPPVMIITALQTSGAFPQMDAEKGWCGCFERKGLVN